MNEDKENIGKEFEDTLKFIFNQKKASIKQNIKRSFIIDKSITYYDFKNRYTEDEARKILKEEFKLSSKELEKELDIIYHNTDTDFSLPILFYTNNKREGMSQNNK